MKPAPHPAKASRWYLPWLAGVLILAGLPVSGHACGLSWAHPGSHFEGVSYRGYVYHIYEIAGLEDSQKRKLPVWLMFNSDWQQASPYAGYGWSIPFLESKVFQLDENTFQINQPDGYFRHYWRDRNNPNLLNGQGGWKAEIRGDQITAYATCGVKLTYNRGRITSMDWKGDVFRYAYSGGRVSEVTKNGQSVLKVETDSRFDEVTGMILADGTRMELEQADRPIPQVVQGQNLLGAVTRSLGRIKDGQGKERTFEFGVDDQIRPLLTVDGNREISWDITSNRIGRDGEWTYEVKPGEQAFSNAAIGRSNAQGQKEFWYRDNAKGEETAVNAASDGATRITTWFTSGQLSGKARRVVEARDNQYTDKYSATYSEEGKVLRKTIENFRFNYNSDGGLVAITDEVSGSVINFSTVKSKQ